MNSKTPNSNPNSDLVWYDLESTVKTFVIIDGKLASDPEDAVGFLKMMGASEDDARAAVMAMPRAKAGAKFKC